MVRLVGGIDLLGWSDEMLRRWLTEEEYGGKWKIVQYSARPETAISIWTRTNNRPTGWIKSNLPYGKLKIEGRVLQYSFLKQSINLYLDSQLMAAFTSLNNYCNKILNHKKEIGFRTIDCWRRKNRHFHFPSLWHNIYRLCLIGGFGYVYSFLNFYLCFYCFASGRSCDRLISSSIKKCPPIVSTIAATVHCDIKQIRSSCTKLSPDGNAQNYIYQSILF